jgi:hypothetical protein
MQPTLALIANNLYAFAAKYRQGSRNGGY